jgi:hypothetical protein
VAARAFGDTFPEKQRSDQRQKEHRVQRERRHRAGCRDDNAADRRAYTPRHIIADAIQGDCRGERFRRHLLCDGGLPSRSHQRHAAADGKAESQQEIGRDQAEPSKCRQRARAGQGDAQRDQRHDAAIVHIRDRARGYRDQHDRRCECGLHKCHLVSRGRQLRHRPGGADALNQNPDIGKQAGEPDTPEGDKAQWGSDAVGANLMGLGRNHRRT